MDISRIQVTQHAVKRIEDWSLCRSAARAKRRWKRGFKQRMRVVETPTAYVFKDRTIVHPVIYDAMRRGGLL